MPHPKAKKVTIGGADYFIAPLSMAKIEDLSAVLGNGTATIIEKRDAVWDSIYASLKRAGVQNLPTLDELKDWLDAEDFVQFQNEVFAISGVRPLT